MRLSNTKIWLVIGLLFLTMTTFANESSKPKIISLTPSFTDIVVDFGATDQLVGASTFDKQRLPILESLDSVGNFQSYSLEKIISLKPDIVLIWPSAITDTQQQQLSSMGIKVITRDPQTLDELVSDVVYLGKLIGKEQQGNQLAKALQEKLSRLRTRYSREIPVTVFYQVYGSPIYTIGKKQIINDALKVCGAKNIFDDIDLPAPQVSIESILARNPQIIIATEQPLLDSWQAWPILSAVKNKKLILLQDDRIARPSIEMVDAIQKLCTQLNK